MNNPLDLDAIKARAEAATAGPWHSRAEAVFRNDDDPDVGPITPWVTEAECVADAEFIAHARTDVPALVAEVERLHTISADLVMLVQPILDRTEGQIGTHSDRCFEYHVACLAGLVQARLTVPSSLNSQEDSNG